MKHLLLASIALAAISPALFASDIVITFAPATVIYPPGLDAFTCQSNGGNSPCLAFSGTIDDIDTDGSFLALADIAVTLNGVGSTHLTPDNTFFNDASGLLAGDPFSNTYSSPIFGLDLNPNTPWGVYTGSIQISGYNLTSDPDETDELVLGQQTFTVNVVPEPFTFGLTAAGMLALVVSPRLRRSRL